MFDAKIDHLIVDKSSVTTNRLDTQIKDITND